MRHLHPGALTASGLALLMVSFGAPGSWGLAPQPPSGQVNAEDVTDEPVADETSGEAEDTTPADAAAPEAPSPPAAGGGGASPVTPTPAAASEDPPLGSSGGGGTGGNGRPTQDPDKPGPGLP